MIQKIGRYAAIDDNGFIVPDVAWDSITPHWQTLITDIVQFIESQHDQQIVSLYVRGSVPRGLAIDYLSDLDLVFVTSERVEELPQSIVDFRQQLLKTYDFCSGIEWRRSPLAELAPDVNGQPSQFAKLLKTQCLHIWGDNVSLHLPAVKPGLAMASHIYNFAKDWSRYPLYLQEANTQTQIDAECLWMGKRILRTLFELSALQKPRFTRDLYYCYEAATDVYPNMRQPLYQVLDLTLQTHVRKNDILPIFTPVAEFVLETIKVSDLA